jgi:hypothetical protein
MSLDQIVGMKDTTFFKENQKIDNLFYLVFKRDNEI